MEIKKPIELAGLKSRLLRAKKQEASISDLGQRYDKVQDAIDDAISAGKSHVGDLESYHADLKSTIEGMVGSNGGDPLDGQTSQSGDVIETKKD